MPSAACRRKTIFIPENKMPEETNNIQPNANPEAKPVLPEAPTAKPILPEAPAAKPVLPEAPAAKPAPAASAPKISLPTAEPKAAAKPSVALPRANTARPAFKPASAKPVQPVKMADDSPSAVSVAVDFVAAAVAVAFAVMILLDV
ncbi:MAG: hypothetical protein DBY30_01205 [Verrucomicrobia bacterium]|nr:MAG: hypothetical protein DBY30_01205 [Verrucomicrobiota bacterium]